MDPTTPEESDLELTLREPGVMAPVPFVLPRRHLQSSLPVLSPIRGTTRLATMGFLHLGTPGELGLFLALKKRLVFSW